MKEEISRLYTKKINIITVYYEMKIEFDKEADAIYIEFSREFAKNKKIDNETMNHTRFSF